MTIPASTKYGAGGLRRFLFGANYRDLWAAPLRVPVLDLQTFAGGLRPLKAGGGMQTKSLRLLGADGVEYVFRSVDKDHAVVPEQFKGTSMEGLARDGISASHPGAALVTAPLLDAVGILHTRPQLAVMPDDPALGEFRKDFAGRLGIIEEYPSQPEHGRGFGGAIDIIDSDTLRVLLNASPEAEVDTRMFLTARLMDMLFNDWDRHPGQWKWAKLEPGPGAMWEPIPRDRDKAFISFGGVILALVRKASPNLMTFEATYPGIRGLTWNSLEFDRRLLASLERPVWDSVAKAIVRRVTDSVIDVAVQQLPGPYQGSAPELDRKLRARRDHLPDVAAQFYRLLAGVVDIHATDANDRATISRVNDDTVAVSLDSDQGRTYFRRRFDRRETHEIRVYLHGGDDLAVIAGNVHQSIPVRVIGGNGTNQLVDSSIVGGRRQPTELVDNGTVEGIRYKPDTLFNREPSVSYFGKFERPSRSRGKQIGPVVGFGVGDLGAMPRVGLSQSSYGFRRRPYASRIELAGEYATVSDGFRVWLTTDHRLESSSIHFSSQARMSELEVTSFHGFGNHTSDSPGNFFDVRQQQWLFHPSMSVAYAREGEISFGPVVQYSVTDNTPGRFISAAKPYGFGRFGQAGLRLGVRHDTRNRPANPQRGVVLDLNGVFFPALWDVKSAFGNLTAVGAAYFTVPVPAHPILALRGGGAKVFGTFPFHEAAFVGGAATVRSLVPDRYAGDAALFGTAELRLPVAHVAFILPLDIGIYGLLDAGRVYVDGGSPGGWHTAVGGGFWVGLVNPANGIRVELTNGEGRNGVLIRTGLTF